MVRTGDRGYNARRAALHLDRRRRLLAAVAVAAGAFGAHGLAERLEPRALGLWETAARYLMYAAFGLLFLILVILVAGWAAARGRSGSLTASAGSGPAHDVPAAAA